MSGMDIVAEARTYLAPPVPWVHQGRTRDGVDCLGLVELVLVAKRGYKPTRANYAAQAKDETMIQECARHMDRIMLTAIEPGDVVVTKFHNQRHIVLIGDYPAQGALSVIHAAQFHGRVLECRYDSVWQRIAMSAFRPRDLRELA